MLQNLSGKVYGIIWTITNFYGQSRLQQHMEFLQCKSNRTMQNAYGQSRLEQPIDMNRFVANTVRDNSANDIFRQQSMSP
ncbi:hypothetical protein CDAR_496891 [Caerostris darwini]|uniref:Uncharacterized protein n=1 Tax=Caerostris darwini TaxID=1538125 RepID=A0AAV4U5G5_9ARAC|nr:hypothetical protein CDAR_496891 [Caerostris darwini]